MTCFICECLGCNSHTRSRLFTRTHTLTYTHHTHTLRLFPYTHAVAAIIATRTDIELSELFTRLDHFDIMFFKNSRAVELVHHLINKGSLQVCVCVCVCVC
jgi:hypothetical protein